MSNPAFVWPSLLLCALLPGCGPRAAQSPNLSTEAAASQLAATRTLPPDDATLRTQTAAAAPFLTMVSGSATAIRQTALAPTPAPPAETPSPAASSTLSETPTFVQSTATAPLPASVTPAPSTAVTQLAPTAVADSPTPTSAVIPIQTAAPSPTVPLKCTYTWFFDNPPPACPSAAPAQSAAASERFEHGQMIWVNSIDQFYVLLDIPIQASPTNLVVIGSPLNFKPGASVDNRTGETPPPGLYEPVSGFGFLWRGEVEGAEAIRSQLGWATEPESGFTTTYQCEADLGGPYWNCYLRTADNQTLHLYYLQHFGYYWETH